MGKKPTKGTEKAIKDLEPKTTEDVQGGRAAKAQSDISSKYSQTKDGIAQNFK